MKLRHEMTRHSADFHRWRVVAMRKDSAQAAINAARLEAVRQHVEAKLAVSPAIERLNAAAGLQQNGGMPTLPVTGC